MWTAAGWYDRFGLPFDPSEHRLRADIRRGRGVHGASAELLLGYHDAVHERTLAYVRTLTDADLDRVVDGAGIRR